MSIVGVLIADPRSGTAIKMDPSQTAWREVFAETMVPVAWPAGFTARRRGLEVEVLRAGEVVVTTGTHVVLSTAFEDSPVHSGIFPACDGKQLPPD